MIEIKPKSSLTTRTEKQLQKYRDEVALQATFDEKAKTANNRWEKWKEKAKVAYKDVKNWLNQMCPADGICCYCEMNEHFAIDHIYPKSLYPSKTFDETNYLYACTLCNSVDDKGNGKGDKFAIFDGQTIPYQDITPPSDRTKYTPPTQEYTEAIVFINSRVENPMDFMELDLVSDGGTAFCYVPKDSDTNSQNYHRADYTIKTLDLNRKILRDDRANAYDSFIQKLSNYLKENDLTKKTIIKEEIQNMKQKSVWYEMKRYYKESLDNPKLLDFSFIRQINEIFNQIPDINTW